MEGFNPFKNKKSKTESKLDKISKIAKLATLGTGLAMGASNLEAQEIHQNKNDGIQPELEKNINVEDEKSKLIKGGNIGEVTVYSKRKYVDELKKQQEKYLADMAKYKKDSAEWVQANDKYIQANKLYNDSLKIHNITNEIWEYGNIIRGIYENISRTNTMSDSQLKEYLKTHDKLEKAESVYHKYWAEDEGTKNMLPIKNRSVDFMTGINGKISDFITDKGYAYRFGDANADIYKKPILPVEPIVPNKLNFPNKVNYDPKFENLKMRSLWATILKQNPNAKIGTLHSLDPLFEKGFTLDEAITFPQEIKDQYNIDYIYNQTHGTKKQKEDYKHPGWDYNEPTK